MDEQKPKKRKNLFVRLLAFLVTLALAAGAVFLVSHRDLLDLDAWKRYMNYRTLERADSGQAASFTYSGSASDVFAALGDDLLVCSEGGVRLYSGSGVCYVEDSILLDEPAVEVCGGTAAVYSVGGSNIYLYRDRARYHVLEDLDGAILSVRLNSSGWLAVTAREGGYKAVITIYDDALNKRMAFRLSSAFITDAAVTEDCRSLAAVAIGQSGAAFESSLCFYTLPDSSGGSVDYDLSPAASHSLGNNVILELTGSSGLWCVGDSGVSVWNGKTVGSWSFQGEYLKGSAVGSGFAAVLIGKYQTGSQAELYTVDAQGTPSVGRVFSRQVLSLSAAGRYIAVLTADRLEIYTRDLELYAALDGVDGARKALMRDDGTALLIGSETASLFVPD